MPYIVCVERHELPYTAVFLSNYLQVCLLVVK